MLVFFHTKAVFMNRITAKSFGKACMFHRPSTLFKRQITSIHRLFLPFPDLPFIFISGDIEEKTWNISGKNSCYFSRLV